MESARPTMGFGISDPRVSDSTFRALRHSGLHWSKENGHTTVDNINPALPRIIIRNIP